MIYKTLILVCQREKGNSKMTIKLFSFFWRNLSSLKAHGIRSCMSLASLSFYILWMVSFPIWTTNSLFSVESWGHDMAFPLGRNVPSVPWTAGVDACSGHDCLVSSPGVQAHYEICTSSRKKKGVNLVFKEKSRFTSLWAFELCASLGKKGLRAFKLEDKGSSVPGGN